MIGLKNLLTGIFVLLMICLPAPASAYNLLKADEFKLRLDTGVPQILVDIQPKNAYLEHHFFGSIRTFAYPAKTEKDTQSLFQAVTMYKKTQNELVIIGPLGGRAAKRSFDYLVSRGIPEEKLFILQGGLRQWPYPEKLLKIRGGCD